MLTLKSLIILLALSLGLRADSQKERTLKQQLSILQISLAAKDLEIRNLSGRLFTLQATLDSTAKASQVLAKANTELLQHDASAVATQSALVGQVASIKTAAVDAKVDTDKILQAVSTAKVVAVQAKQTLIRSNQKHDDQHAEQQAATQALLNTTDKITQQLIAEHALNQKMSKAIVQVEGLLRGAQRILFISLVTVVLLLITCFLLLRDQYKRRHPVAE